MKKIEIEELKELQLEILLEVDSFCKQNGINYSLAYGTLLGAVRHNGYIPWDDDIDIMMCREDYEKFLKKFNGNSENLQVIAPEINLNYYVTWANVFDKRTILNEERHGGTHRGIEIGVKIDIFPIDIVPDSPKDYKCFKRKIAILNLLRYSKCRSLTHIKRRASRRIFYKSVFVRFCSIFFSYKWLQKVIILMASKYKASNNQLCAPVTYMSTLSYNTPPLPRSIFNNYTKVQFEGHELSSIVDYNQYLCAEYGDYMRLPPINERVNPHCFEAYWK